MKFIWRTLLSSAFLLSFSPEVICKTHVEKVKDTGNSSEKTELVTFLGVEAKRVSDALRQHVDIPDGVGLIIEKVVENSPAEAAGIEHFDILLELDGQIIVNPEQLTTLVRSKEAGDVVEVEVFRKGERREFPVKLDEREIPQGPGAGQHFGFSGPSYPRPRADWDIPFVGKEKFERHVKEVQKKVAEIRNKALQYAPEIVVERENEDGSLRTTTYSMGQKRVRLSKNGIVATVEIVDGEKHFHITDRDEKVLYEGGEPGEEDLEKLPPEVRPMLKKLSNPESFQLKSLKDMKSDKIRVIINSDEEEEVEG